MIKGFLSGVVLIVSCVITYLIFHLGLFLPVQINEETRPDMFILFKDHIGPYHTVAELISSVEVQAKRDGLDCSMTFGEYFDNPDNVEQDRLRSRVGCISNKPYAKTPLELKTDKIPTRRYVVGYFLGSPAIGPWKVYPKIKKYLSEWKIAREDNAIEIYTMTDESINTEYLFPLK